MPVRAKIKVASMQMFGPQSKSDTEVTFMAVYKDDPSHENKQFWKFTPNIQFKMTLAPIAGGAVEFFRRMLEEGTEMYLDFTEAPPS